MFSLSNLLFVCKDGNEALKSWLSYIKSINEGLYCKLKEMLPEAFLSSAMHSDVKSLEELKGNYKGKMEKVCIDVSLAILFFYNNEFASGLWQLEKIKRKIVSTSSSKITVENIINVISFPIKCYFALLFDGLTYIIKVGINPIAWFSSSKRDTIAESCDSCRKLIKKHNNEKSKDKELDFIAKQVDRCVKICKEIKRG